jgi:hypothetical protein
MNNNNLPLHERFTTPVRCVSAVVKLALSLITLYQKLH